MKNKLRKECKLKRSLLDSYELSNAVMKNFLDLDEYKNSSHIMTYYSFNNEVNTHFCFSIKEKNWYLPKIKNNDLLVCPYSSIELCENKYKILEPTTDDIKNISIIDMVIIPCIAADKNGYRIGYGKGYYDRFLSYLNKDVIKVIFCYSDLLLDNVFPEAHDIKADIVVTDKKIYKINC